MIRLRVAEDGELRWDDGDGGRGGYLHRRAECWRAFLRRKSIYRAFRVEVDKGAKERLVRELEQRKSVVRVLEERNLE
jgi:predicted RNA-binding protein YlxR (DUF448 family)